MNNLTELSGKYFAPIKKLGITPPMAVLFLALILAPIFIKDEFILRLMISSLMFGGLAMAFDFTAGYINIVNFGFAAFLGLGAYTSGLMVLNFGLSPWIGILCGALVAGLLGFGLGLLTIRLGGIFAACMTWFVALALMAVVGNWVELTKGNSGLSVPPLFDTIKNLPYYYTILVIVIFIYIALILISKSKIGLAFRAIGQDVVAAASSGLFATRYKIINFTISCLLAGLIGGFYAHFVGVLTPQVLHTRNTVEIMAISYIGGRGTIWGAFVAALIMVPLMDYLKSLLELRLIFYGAAMIIVMIFFPKGLAGLWESGMNLIFRRGGAQEETRKEA